MNKKESKNWFINHPVLTAIFSIVFLLFVLMIVTTDDDSQTSKLGEQQIYNSIDNTIDCKDLQEVFNIAMDNVERRQPGDELRKVSLSYATYANTRMNNLDC